MLYEQSIGISIEHTVRVWVSLVPRPRGNKASVWVCPQFHTHPARYQCALGMWGAEGDLTIQCCSNAHLGLPVHGSPCLHEAAAPLSRTPPGWRCRIHPVCMGNQHTLKCMNFMQVSEMMYDYKQQSNLCILCDMIMLVIT